MKNKKVCVNYYGHQFARTVRRELSDDEIDQILKACKDSKILNWKKRYVKYFINDGSQWSVSINMKDGTTRTTYSSNRTPIRYSHFGDAIYEIMYTNTGNSINVYSQEDIEKLAISSEEDVEKISDEILISIAIAELKSGQNITDYNYPTDYWNYIAEDEMCSIAFINCDKENINSNKSIVNFQEKTTEYINNLSADQDIGDFDIIYCEETDEYIEYKLKYNDNDSEKIVFLKDVYECGSKYFLTGELSTDRVKMLFDLLLSFQNANGSEELIYRDVEETEGTFVYNFCSYLVSYGDYEAKDSVVLKKQAIILDKTTREYSFSNPTIIREVEVEDYIFGW